MRLLYVLRKKERKILLSRLEKNNNEMNQLLGNISWLEPARRKRRSEMPTLYGKFRRQAISLHKAIICSLRCNCSSTHSSKLLLADTEQTTSTREESSSTGFLKLRIYFPRQSRLWSGVPSVMTPEHDWYASEITMAKTIQNSVPCASYNRGMPSQTRHSLNLSVQSISSINDNKIHNLCHTLNQSDRATSCLGYLMDEEYHHIISRSTRDHVLPRSTRKIATLGDLIRKQNEDKVFSAITEPILCREERLRLALRMTKALLQLYSSPWLSRTWCKDDIYFFEDKSGNVRFDVPFLVTNFEPSASASTSAEKPTKPQKASLSPAKSEEYESTRLTLLSLGILILELYFNKSIESCPWLGNYLGPNGYKNEYTIFNTAITWQKQALEEGGIDLHNVTSCCIFGSFGMPMQDLGDRELQSAVHSNVIEPLERMLARFKLS